MCIKSDGFRPGSGRFAGYCGRYPAPGYANFVPGRRAEKVCYSRPWFNSGRVTAELLPRSGLSGCAAVDEKEYLKQQAEFLREQWKLIEAELENIKRKDEERL